MEIEDRPYDTRFSASAVGHAGLFEGEASRILLGQSLIIGRSRNCGLSVARSAACLRLGKEALDQHSSYRKISRQHVRVTLLSHDHLEVEDLSTNGTVVDGFRIDRRLITNFSERTEGVQIEFGDGEIVSFTPRTDTSTSGISQVSHSVTSA